MDITMYIPTGANNRITSRELEALTGLKGATIRELVNHKREEGAPIGSDNKGYFMAAQPDDLDHTINSLASREKAIKRAREGLINAKYNLIFPEEEK